MRSTLGSRRGMVRTMVLIAALVFTAGTARAQYLGYGYSYGMPYGYGLGYGYGWPGYGYGVGWGYGWPGHGYGLGYGYGWPFYGYGVGGYGPPGLGIYYGYPAFGAFGLFGSGRSILNTPAMNSLFGVGMTPLGLNSYLAESNSLGRAQLGAAQRARAREQQGNNGR